MLHWPIPSLLLDPAAPDVRWLIVGGVGLLVIYILMRPKKKDPLASGPRMSLGQQKSIERQMETLLVEFSKMARQMSAQLDTRAAKLELLIKEADEKLAALRAAMGAVEAGNGDAAYLAKLARSAKEFPPGAAPIEPPPSGPPAPIRAESRHADVYALADQGRSCGEIARELGRPDGEIELILALRAKT